MLVHPPVLRKEPRPEDRDIDEFCNLELLYVRTPNSAPGHRLWRKGPWRLSVSHCVGWIEEFLFRQNVRWRAQFRESLSEVFERLILRQRKCREVASLPQSHLSRPGPCRSRAKLQTG